MRRFPLPASMGAMLLVLSLVYTGCTQGETVTGGAVVSAVTVTPKAIQLNPGRTAQVNGRALDGSGTAITAQLDWTTSSAAVATVSSSGMVTAVGVGTATISAASGEIADQATVTVALAPVATIALSPANPTVVANLTSQLTATLRDASGATLTGREVLWETSDAQVAVVTPSGLVRGVAPGSATITARSEGQAGATTVTVQPAPVATVTLTPPSPMIQVGATVTLVPVLRDATGAELTGRNVTWETSAGGIATVSGSGVVTGVAVGSATITGRSEGRTGTTVVTVQALPPAPVATVTVAPSGQTIFIDGTLQLAATLRSSNGTVLTGRTVTWETSAGNVATVGASTGLVRGIASGTVTITARSEGQSGTATVTVQPVPVASITVTPATPSIGVNATVQLVATLRDANGAVLTGRAVTWESSTLATATVSGSGLVTGVAAGTATVTARSEGQAGSTVVTVQAAPAAVATITLAPASQTLNVDATQQLTPTLRDAQGNVLSGRTVTWETSAAGVAAVSGSGLVRGVAPGTATITARSEGQAGTAAITVQLAPVATIALTPATPSVMVGSTVQMTATLRDAAGTVLTGRTVTWETSASGTATVTAGLVRGVAAGTATITASSEGRTGTTTVTVTALPSAGAIADPTLLPRATAQRPAAGTYGRGLAAGQTYVDPNSGVTVLKLTSATVPAANGGMYHGYSEGGPSISQAWTGTDGQTYYTAKVGDWLVDVRYTTLTPSNWRRVNYDGEIGFAFSLNPSTPRIAYVINGKRVDRYNTATNAIENTGNWPWVITATGTGVDWLQGQLNDTWFVAMIQSNHTVVAFRPSDGVQRAYTESAAGVSIDEPHIDREFPYVYLSTNSSVQNKIVNLETNAYTNPRDPNGVNADDHASPMRGKMVAISWQADGVVTVDYTGTVRTAVTPSPTDWSGDWHQASQWVHNNPSEYFLIDQWADTGNYAIFRGMMGFVSLTGDIRLVAATDATGTGYNTGGQPHPTLAPDGKFVMWTTNMNGSGRYDTFLARIPTR